MQLRACSCIFEHVVQHKALHPLPKINDFVVEMQITSGPKLSHPYIRDHSNTKTENKERGVSEENKTTCGFIVTEFSDEEAFKPLHLS